LTKGHPARLLTTRQRTAAALSVTLFILFLAIRGGLHLGHTEGGWILPLDFVLQGWPLIAANVAFYGYLCWLAFCFIRGSEGRERIFMAGWFVHLALYPVEKLWPQSSAAMQYVTVAGLAVAVLAAVSLLLNPAPIADSSERTA
jgi:hypothetical protein